MSTYQAPEGFWIAKLSGALAGGDVEVSYLSSAQAGSGKTRLQQGTLSGLTGGLKAGRHHASWSSSDGGKAQEVVLDVSERGPAFDLQVDDGRSGKVFGMGIRDPQSPDALIVSWWSGRAISVGIVKYIINPAETNRIDAIYTSIAVRMAGVEKLLGGRATGDTSDGFPGRYQILYEGVHDTSHGPFDWEITRNGDLHTLTWQQDGQMVLRGFGFEDPEHPQSLIVNYWMGNI
jgi:hypothetical protein